MGAPERQLVAFLAGWLSVLVQYIDVAPLRPRAATLPPNGE
jgi:hypothetical protein